MSDGEKTIKICMITHAFYPEYSGAATQCLSLSKELLKKNCQIVVLTFTNNYNLLSRERIEGIDVIRILVNKKGLTGPFTAIKLLSLLIKERNKFDIIHFHGFNNHLLWIAWLNYFLRKKIIIKMSLMGYDTPKAIMAKGIFHRFAYRELDSIIATTSAMMKELKEYPFLKSKGYLIPNGVDTNKFRPATEKEKIKLRKKLGIPLSRKIILFSGVICKRKGIDILLSAWEMLYRRLKKSCPTLLIAGSFETDIRKSNIESDQLKLNVMKMARKYPENFLLLGARQNIEEIYMAADLFVLPSQGEGMPNALLEAMSSGLTCIVINLPGICDLIAENEETGIILRGMSSDSLSEVVLKALENNMIGYFARQKIVSKFSINMISESYLKCYQDIQ